MNIPAENRLLPIYISFTKWLIQTSNQNLLISYNEFETKFIDMLLSDNQNKTTGEEE